MTGLDARFARFDAVTVLNQPMLFTCCRVEKATVPEGLYLYEVRQGCDPRGCRMQIAKDVPVNLFGTLLTAKPIPLGEIAGREYRSINGDTDWNFDGYMLTAYDYLKLNPPIQRIQIISRCKSAPER